MCHEWGEEKCKHVLGTYDRIILKCMLRTHNGRAWTIWLSTGTSDGLLYTQ